MTREQARECARKFVQDFVNANRQWRTWDIEMCLPEGFTLRADAEFCDRPTVENIATFLRSAAEQRT